MLSRSQVRRNFCYWKQSFGRGRRLAECDSEFRQGSCTSNSLVAIPACEFSLIIGRSKRGSDHAGYDVAHPMLGGREAKPEVVVIGIVWGRAVVKDQLLSRVCSRDTFRNQFTEGITNISRGVIAENAYTPRTHEDQCA